MMMSSQVFYIQRMATTHESVLKKKKLIRPFSCVFLFPFSWIVLQRNCLHFRKILGVPIKLTWDTVSWCPFKNIQQSKSVILDWHSCGPLRASAHLSTFSVFSSPPVEIRGYISVFPSLCLHTVPALPPFGVTAQCGWKQAHSLRGKEWRKPFFLGQGFHPNGCIMVIWTH